MCGAGGDDDGDYGQLVAAVRASGGAVGGGSGVVEGLGHPNAVGDGAAEVVDDVDNAVTDLGYDAAALGEHVPSQCNELAVRAPTDVILPRPVYILPTRN